MSSRIDLEDLGRKYFSLQPELKKNPLSFSIEPVYQYSTFSSPLPPPTWSNGP